MTDASTGSRASERGFDAVLFDLHGVLTSSPWAALAAVGTDDGSDQAAVLELMLGDYATDTDHPWHRLERGEIPMAEYGMAVMKLAADAGMTLDFSKLRGFSDRIQVNQQVVDKVRSLRSAGYRTGLVTNNVKEMASGWRALLPADELFEVVVDSSDVGVRKPNPAIFSIALDRLGGVDPARAIFLDDAPGNVEGARAAGLSAILVDDVDEALVALDVLLG
ncbi:MAG TPA: HAD family phosphatase [Acidimicrobiales bacterium]|nr:HAD family phosphatase [Acidimicrobiales bacterium]